ncbi:hypothetical protein FGIG_08742 [Fasciola gigantica]|uniref:Major facilitator superfamily (MFS) profile domain-containing protein n=1 Tax=Fasciola gigantica TaxID=46835 RepID=A0A504Z4I0_FASGI|nr:hypothetical protein FGIG_08742 [Fasciola gigantica]
MNASDRAQIHTDYPDRCYHRQTDLIQMAITNETNWTDWTPDQLFKLAVGRPVPCDNGYVYEPIPNQYPTSVIASFDLTCDRSWLGPLHPTMFMVGMLFGYYLGAVPGTVISCILYRVFRWRKRPLLGVFALAFLSTFIGTVFTLTQNYGTDLLLMITEGMALIALEAALDMIFIYIPELFPTMFRSKSLGFCGGFARIGAALCRFTNELDSRLGHGSPMAFTLSCCAWLTVLLYCFLIRAAKIWTDVLNSKMN